ncbi:MAG: C/D box methylation guide ribonucleoprotein complex aNOP56 subunit [Thermoprotei archaeon]|nr:MAG: C/D box methylation guide ribonucleoprotein complex aNOP56 subunit [Thermoprotei archaeon]
MGEKYYLIGFPLGFLILDDGGKIVEKEFYEKNPSKIAENIYNLEKGTVIRELEKLLDRFSRKHPQATIILEDEALAKTIASKHRELNVTVELPSKGSNVFRLHLEEYLQKFGITYSEYLDLLWKVTHEEVRLKIKETAEKRDLFIAQAISALDETDKTINLYASRIREWYSLHFPELNSEIRDHRLYISIIYNLGSREQITEEELIKKLGLDEKKAKKIAELAKTSMGADITAFDIGIIKQLTGIVLQLYDLRKFLEEYIDEAMKDVAPNIRGLVGPLLGARLIALAGGIRKLATLPASTIQVLGAEKALFRALRSGSKPPKHGVIFTYPAIFRAKRWQRGKIARALAAKLAIAARIDAFTGEYKADLLKEELEKRINEIKTLYAKPPKREEKPPVRKRFREKKRKKRRR